MDVANLDSINAANNNNNVQQTNANNNQLSNIPGHQISNAGNNNVANPAAQQIFDKNLNQRNVALDKSMNDEISELKASLSEAFVKIDDSKKISNTFDEKSILGTKEVNIIVNDYDDAILFLKGCGLTAKAVQETKREIWILDSCEISIDTWPWLPTFMEIEGPSEDEVWAAAQILGYTKAQAKFGSVDSTYQHYYGVDEEIVNQHTPEITFEMTPPKWAQKRVS